jgi:hypothetical protein
VGGDEPGGGLEGAGPGTGAGALGAGGTGGSVVGTVVGTVAGTVGRVTLDGTGTGSGGTDTVTTGSVGGTGNGGITPLIARLLPSAGSPGWASRTHPEGRRFRSPPVAD